MQLRISHLRRGELVAASCAVVLLVQLFGLPWFATATGWQSLPVVRRLLLVTAAVGLLLAVFQETRRAPALPVMTGVILAALMLVTGVILAALTLVTAIVLVIRLPMSTGTPEAGAYLGLAAVLGILIGAFYSLRDEDGWQPGPDRPIERLSLPSAEPR